MWLLFIALAAMLNALMDRVENENFSASVFRNLNPKFWYKRESWKWAKQIGGYRLDAWHLAKSAMLVLLITAAVAYSKVINWYIDVVVAGGVWILVFNLFYNKIFHRERD